MGLRYRQSVFGRSPASLEGPSDVLSSAAMTPEIDFTKSSLAEQSPEAKTIGGEDVTGQDAATPTDWKGAGLQGAKTLAKGGSGTDAAAAGLMATGHPAGIAAGLGLMTLSTIEKKKQEQKQTKYLAQLKEVEARRDALNKLADIGQRLKA